MGQKVNPIALRGGIVKTWSSTWYADGKTYTELLHSDLKLRKYLEKKFHKNGISHVEIDRKTDKSVKVTIHTAKPGMIIGRGGSEIDKLRLELEGVVKQSVFINIAEIKDFANNAQLIADNVAFQLEKRVSFRKTMKQSITRARRIGSKGVKIQVSGRLAGADMARTEHYMEGRVPLHTLRANIEYAQAKAFTTYGVIGVKAWVYKGDVLGGVATVDGEKKTRNARRS
jgi:small subunit ribosomal protein S3